MMKTRAIINGVVVASVLLTTTFAVMAPISAHTADCQPGTPGYHTCQAIVNELREIEYRREQAAKRAEEQRRWQELQRESQRIQESINATYDRMGRRAEESSRRARCEENPSARECK